MTQKDHLINCIWSTVFQVRRTFLYLPWTALMSFCLFVIIASLVKVSNRCSHSSIMSPFCFGSLQATWRIMMESPRLLTDTPAECKCKPTQINESLWTLLCPKQQILFHTEGMHVLHPLRHMWSPFKDTYSTLCLIFASSTIYTAAWVKMSCLCLDLNPFLSYFTTGTLYCRKKRWENMLTASLLVLHCMIDRKHLSSASLSFTLIRSCLMVWRTLIFISCSPCREWRVYVKNKMCKIL